MKYTCKRCGKGFSSESSVLNHQNQPSSNCAKHYNIILKAQNLPTLVTPSPCILPPPPASPVPPPPASPAPPPPLSPIYPVTMDIEMMDISEPDDQPSTGDETLPQTLPFHTQFYTGAAKIWDNGETFIDIFNDDEHAEKRKENLYYPFATYQEWELAAFLLKSDLSMVATNDFLRLQLASDICGSKHSICVLNLISLRLEA